MLLKEKKIYKIFSDHMDKKYNFLKPIKTTNLIRLGRKADESCS